MRKLNTLLLLLILCASQAFGQQRYLDEIFSSVKETKDTTYGVNITIYPIVLGLSTTPLPENLKMDVYEPMGDTVSNRPVVIMLHTGTFLGPVINQSPYGGRKDSFNVEFCRRMARRGYVAISASYRLGWNPTSLDPEVKRQTILAAAYRGIQDARTCVRYLRYTADSLGNPWKIDPTKIALGGTGTGGYVAYGVGFLNNISKEILLPKFFNFDSTPPQPYVDTMLLGDPYGIVPAPLNNPNHTAQNSEIQMGFALGGALGDISWVDPGEPPFAAMQNPNDQFAPYEIDDVIETVNFDVVIRTASGAYTTIRSNADTAMNNDVWKGVAWSDPYNQYAATINDGIEGLYPFHVPFTPGSNQCLPPPFPADTVSINGAPWYWFDTTWYRIAWGSLPNAPYPGTVEVCRELASDPDMSAARGRTYTDTIVGYLAPRMALALGLSTTTRIDELKTLTQLQAYPNPAEGMLSLSSGSETPMLGVEVLDAMGRRVASNDALRTNRYVFDGSALSPGLYFVKVRFKEGVVTQKVLFK